MISLHLFTIKHEAACNEDCAQTSIFSMDLCISCGWRSVSRALVIIIADKSSFCPSFCCTAQHIFMSAVVLWELWPSVRDLYQIISVSGLLLLLYTLRIKASGPWIIHAREEALFFRVCEAVRGIGCVSLMWQAALLSRVFLCFPLKQEVGVKRCLNGQ